MNIFNQPREVGPGLGNHCDYWTGTELIVDCAYPMKKFVADNWGWLVIITLLLVIIIFLLLRK